MNDAIYLINDASSKTSIRLEPTPYGTEDEFQTLLERFPELLAGEQIDRDNPRRWLLVGREIGIPDSEGLSARWALDHLFVDQDGTPTLVEVKRQSDTRIRREVVGQVLEYAANAAKWWPCNFLQGTFESTCRRDNKDPEATLSGFLGPGGQDPTAFWATVAKRLEAGDMRLIFFADSIPTELLRIVEFLNSQMLQTEVLAIEVQRYSGDGFSTHVPRLLGKTLQAQLAKQSGRGSSSRRQWDETSFFGAAQSLSATTRAALRRIYDLSLDPLFSIRFGSGVVNGSINIYRPDIGSHALASVLSNGNLQLMYGALTGNALESRACDRLAQFAESALGWKLGPEWRKQYPTIPPESWIPSIDALIATLKDLG
jgi:hypothetical protein